MRINVYLLLAFTFMLSSCQAPVKLIEGSGTWTQIEAVDNSKPIKRHEAAFARVKDKLVLFGGRRINPVSVYDTQLNQWVNKNTVPIEMHHFQAVVYKSQLLILGAFTGKYPREKPVPNIYSYDPEEDKWTKGSLIPKERQRGGAGAVAYKGNIYLACGIKDGHRGDHKKWLDKYNPQTGEWEILPDAPRPRDHFQAIVANDKLYLIGGRTTISKEGPFKNTIKEVDVYDFKANSWSTLDEGIPTPRAGNYAVLYGDYILVMGGESASQKAAHNEVEALNVKTQEWTTLNPMLRGRHGTGVILYKDKFYVASGSGNRGGGPELTTMECMSF
ncbi:MAG: kelch repeat-containing protein [Bacteroidota bacterium]